MGSRARQSAADERAGASHAASMARNQRLSRPRPEEEGQEDQEVSAGATGEGGDAAERACWGSVGRPRRRAGGGVWR
ncbi:MAG: hypothetical protein ACK51N_00450, partial [bacterium]